MAVALAFGRRRGTYSHLTSSSVTHYTHYTHYTQRRRRSPATLDRVRSINISFCANSPGSRSVSMANSQILAKRIALPEKRAVTQFRRLLAAPSATFSEVHYYH